MPPSSIQSNSPSRLPSVSSAVLGVMGRNTFWLLADRIGLRLGAMAAGLALVRYLGPKEYGFYVMALAAGALLNAVTDLGLTRYATRAVASDPCEARRILGLSLIVTAAAFVLELAGFGCSVALRQWHAAGFAAAFILTNLDGTSSLCSALLLGELRSKAIMPGSVVSTLGTIGAAVAVIHWKLPVLALFMGLAVRSVVVFATRLIQLRHSWPASSDLRPAELRAVAGRARSYFSYSIADMGYTQAPPLCLSLAASSVQVGRFAAAMAIANIVPQWIFASIDGLVPVATKMLDEGRGKDLLQLLQRLLELSLLVTVLFGAVLCAFAPEVCALLGPQYMAAAPALRIAAFLTPVSCVWALLGGVLLTAADLTPVRRNKLLGSLAVLIVLELVLGRVWGAAGAAGAVTISAFLLAAMYSRACAKVGLSLSVAPSLGFVSTGIAAIGAFWFVLGSWHTSVNPILCIAGAALVYLLAVTLVNRPALVGAGVTLRQSFAWRAGQGDL